MKKSGTWQGEDTLAKKTAPRFVVRDRGGVKHLAYRGATGIVGFTICKVAIKFKGTDLPTASAWTLMRESQGKITCMRCLAEEGTEA